jgi:1-acyl-sn-glycerol-3-phosphate acyltransferase
MSAGILRRCHATVACLVAGAWHAGRVAGGDADQRLALQQAWLERLGQALEIEVIVSGDPPPVRALWVANHVSWLDVVALGRLRALQFVAKRELAHWPLVGRLARAAGTRFTERDSWRGLRALVEDLAGELRAGRSVALFPEGTTTRGDVILRFRPLLFQAAVLAGVSVQPVALRYRERGARQVAPYVGDDLFVAHLGRVVRSPPQAVELHFLPRLPAVGQPAHHLARASARLIAEALGLPGLVPTPASRGGETLNLGWSYPG